MQNSKPIVNTKINWKNYNRSLGERANIFSHLPENVEEIWYNRTLTGKRGTPKTYSDRAIIVCLTIAEVYRLPLRQTEGFLNNLFLQIGLNLTCPNYTVLSRRRKVLEIKKTIYRYESDDALLVDASGMKITGDGEWHREYHDEFRRKTWLKLHLGVSWKTRQILAFACTPSSITDGKMFPELLTQVSRSITECIGDGAYDNRLCYESAQKHNLRPVFSIRTGAVEHADDIVLAPRNKAIDTIKNVVDGEKAWKAETGYHRRSLVENAFFRCKTIFGPRVSAKIFSSQIVQMALRINILNRFMTQSR
jgi:hypothetical protein